MYHDRESGLANVSLENGFRKIDTPYGKVVEIEHVEEAWHYGIRAEARPNGPTA